MLPNNTFSYTVHSFQTNRILHPAEASSQLTPSSTYQLLFLGLRLVRLSSHHWEFFLVQSARLPIFKRYNYVCNYRKLCITCKRMPKCEIYVHLRLCMFARCWWICNAGRAKRLVINANGLIFQMDFYFHFIYLPCRLILKVNKVCELANLNFLSPSCSVRSRRRCLDAIMHLPFTYLIGRYLLVQLRPPTARLLHCINYYTHTLHNQANASSKYFVAAFTSFHMHNTSWACGSVHAHQRTMRSTGLSSQFSALHTGNRARRDFDGRVRAPCWPTADRRALVTWWTSC